MRYSLNDFKRDHIEVNAHHKNISALCVIRSPILTQHDHRSDVLLTSAGRDGSLKFWDICSSSKMHLEGNIPLAHKKPINAACYNSQFLFTASE